MALEQKSDLKSVWPSDPKNYQWKGTLSVHNGVWNVLAHCKPRKEDVFIKIKETQDTADTDIDVFTENTKNLINIQHNNVLTPVHAFVHKSEIWVIYPRHSGGPLIEVLTSHYPNGIPDEGIVASILYDIALGLQNLHKQQQCHRNIRASSIHIDIDEGRALLSEFAELKEIKWKHAAGRRNTFVSPDREPFTDPLILFEDPKASWYAGDIYAFGITALQLTYGSTPPLNTKNIIQNKAQSVTVDLYDKQCPFSKAFEALIKDCCATKLDNRISINELIKHKFFTKLLKANNSIIAIRQYFGHILKSTEKRINSALSAPTTFNGTYNKGLKDNNDENINGSNNINNHMAKEGNTNHITQNTSNTTSDTPNTDSAQWIFSTTMNKDDLPNGPTMHNTTPNAAYNDPSNQHKEYGNMKTIDEDIKEVTNNPKKKRNYHVSFSGSESISHDHDAEANNNNTVQINRFKVEFDSRMSDSGTVGTHIEPSQTNDDDFDVEYDAHHDSDDEHAQNENPDSQNSANHEQTTQIKRFFITPAKPELSADDEVEENNNNNNMNPEIQKEVLQQQQSPPQQKQQQQQDITHEENGNTYIAPSIGKKKWSADDCSKWVGSLGDLYKQYMKPFKDNGIDGAFLSELDDEILKEIITSGLHRKKILLAWGQLQTQ